MKSAALMILQALITTGLVADVAAAAEDWKPAAGRLMTRWAEDVSPENVHPEYPRPQMTRPKWQNLNGLWQLTVAEPDAKPPVGEDLSKRILVPFPVESALSGVMRSAEWVSIRRRVPKVGSLLWAQRAPPDPRPSIPRNTSRRGSSARARDPPTVANGSDVGRNSLESIHTETW